MKNVEVRVDRVGKDVGSISKVLGVVQRPRNCSKDLRIVQKISELFKDVKNVKKELKKEKTVDVSAKLLDSDLTLTKDEFQNRRSSRNLYNNISA